MSNVSSETQQGSTIAQTPSWLTPYYKQSAANFTNAMPWLPSLTDLYNNNPLLNVPGVTPQQNAAVGSSMNAMAGGAGPQVGASNAALESFLGTPGTPSSATSAELNLFKNQLEPEIMQNAVLMGQGTSGAADAAVAKGVESAMVPFMQQDLSNTLTAAQALGSQGLQTGQLTQEQIMNALTAAGVPYEIAANQAQALFEQQQQRWNFAQGIQTSGQSQFPNLIGSISNSTLQQGANPLWTVLNLLSTFGSNLKTGP